MDSDESENGLYSKIIFCLMAKLGVKEITLTNNDMALHSEGEQQIDVHYKLNAAAGYVTVSYGPVKE